MDFAVASFSLRNVMKIALLFADSRNLQLTTALCSTSAGMVLELCPHVFLDLQPG